MSIMEQIKARRLENRIKNNWQNKQEISSECICERPQRNLICLNCHRRLFGRVHKVCQKHPKVGDLFPAIKNWQMKLVFCNRAIAQKQFIFISNRHIKFDNFLFVFCSSQCSYLYDHASCPCGGRFIESITEVTAESMWISTLEALSTITF